MFALDLCKVIEKEVQKKINVFFDELVNKHGLDRKELQRIWEGNTEKTPTSFMKMSVKTLKEECKKRKVHVKSRKKMDFVNALLKFEKENKKKDSKENPTLPPVSVPENLNEIVNQEVAPIDENNAENPSSVLEENDENSDNVDNSVGEVSLADGSMNNNASLMALAPSIVQPNIDPIDENNSHVSDITFENHELNIASADIPLQNKESSLEQVNENPVNENPVNGDAVNENPVNGDAVDGDAVDEDAVNQDSVNEDAVNQDSVNEGAVNQDSVDEDAVNQDSVEQPPTVQEPIEPSNESLNLDDLQEKLNSIVKVPFHKMPVKELKKRCLNLGFDCKKKTRKHFIEFLEKYEKNQQKETNFENFLVDPTQIIFE